MPPSLKTKEEAVKTSGSTHWISTAYLYSYWSNVHIVNGCPAASDNLFITPHAQRERGKVIGCGVHIYIYIYMFVDEKNI